MISDVDHDTLNDALRRCGSTWDASQAHGLLSSRLAAAGVDAGLDWLQQVLEGTDESDALRIECANLLNSLYQDTFRQLSERLSSFVPLLPNDSDSASLRTAALAHWCEGFLHGLVSGDHGEALFDRNGNAGPTVWANGRIVGGWAQAAAGPIRFQILEDVSKRDESLITRQAAALESWLGDRRFTPRFRTPLDRELMEGPP